MLQELQEFQKLTSCLNCKKVNQYLISLDHLKIDNIQEPACAYLSKET